jgi:hypothetical protein
MTRVKIKPNQIKYDKSHDVLHVYFLPDFLTVDEEEYPGVLIRRSLKDEETVAGLTILDFNEKKISELDYLLPEYDFSEVYYPH